MSGKRQSRRKERAKKKSAAAAPTPVPGIWDKLDRRWQHGICLAFLMMLPIIPYYDVIIGDQRFFAHDIVQWRASAESIIEHREEFAEDPLWSENMFSGMPAYVISYLRAVPHYDEIVASMRPIMPAAALWTMLPGLYILFIRLKLHPLAAVFGSIAIAFTTYMPIIVGAGHNAKVYALSYIPWVLIGYQMLSHSKKTLLGLFVFALALNLEIRAIHPQVTYFFFYLIGIWWIYDTWRYYKNNELPDWAKRTALMAAGVIIALACNAQPYWSIYEYTDYSMRGGTEMEATDGLSMDYAMAWSQGWFELNTLIIPEIMGGSSFDGGYWGEKMVTNGPHYLGVLVFFLGLLALFRYENKIKYVFLAAGVLTMLFSLGKNFAALNFFMFDYMPLFNRFRAPEMWLMVTTFSFCTLGALGAHWLLTKGPAAGIKALYLPGGITLGVGLAFLFLANSVLTYEKPNELAQLTNSIAQQNNLDPNDPMVVNHANQIFNNEIKPEREEKAKSDIFRYLIFAGLGIGIAALFVSGKVALIVAGAAIAVLLAADLMPVGNRYIAPNSKIDASLGMEGHLERSRGSHDDFIQAHNRNSDYPYRVFPVVDNPFNNAKPSYFHPSVGGYTGAKLATYQDLIDHAIFHDVTGLNFPVLDMLNTKWLIVDRPYPFPGYEVVHEGNNRIVLENTNVLPKVFFPNALDTGNSAREMMTKLNDSFDPRETALLMDDTTPDHEADPDADFSLITYRANLLKFEITKSTPGLAVISEMYYPAGWKAFVNDEEVPIYRVNYVLRGIFLDEGTHEVRMEFRPASHFTGRTISWIFNLGLMGFGVIVIFLEYKSRANRPGNPES